MTEIESTSKPGWLLKILVTFATLAHIVLALVVGALNAIGLGVVYYALGHIIALLLMVFLVVGLFQVAKPFRNTRSRLKIYTWTLAVLLVPVLFGVVGTLRSTARGQF